MPTAFGHREREKEVAKKKQLKKAAKKQRAEQIFKAEKLGLTVERKVPKVRRVN